MPGLRRRILRNSSQFASTLAFISKSTSAYTFVVTIDTWPSHARIVLMSTLDRNRCVAVACRMVCEWQSVSKWQSVSVQFSLD